MVEFPVVTVDGLGSTGKGTLSRALSRSLGWQLLDSGAIYRVLAYAATARGIATTDEAALTALAHALAIEFLPDEAGMTRVLLDGAVVTGPIRSEACGQAASMVAALPGVRSALVQRQRDFAAIGPGLVADGRDMGTVIFPQAPAKLFLTADPAERAQRRYNELKQKGNNVTLAQVLDQLQRRDARDAQRAVSPTVPAKDAIILDTSKMTADKVFKQALRVVQDRFQLSVAAT